MPQPPGNLPGKGLFGWFGRQVGHVARAVRTDVTDGPRTVVRTTQVLEQQHPTVPNVTLRRTTVDEVIVVRERPPAP